MAISKPKFLLHHLKSHLLRRLLCTSPEPLSSLSGPRLNLHNYIIELTYVKDFDEASLFLRNSLYSNCRSTIYTCNALMTLQLRHAKYSELISLHGYITQSGLLAPNIVTHNLLLEAYMGCGKTELAMEHYKKMIKIKPSLSTYRILVKGLVDNDEMEIAAALKDEMLKRGIEADPVVYSYLMSRSNVDGIFDLYDELRRKLGGVVLDGVVYGSVMRGYFLMGLYEDAKKCYQKIAAKNSKVKMSDDAYNSILDAMSRNGKFDEALKLFKRLLIFHNPPVRRNVNVGSYNVIVNGYCSRKKFDDAIKVFRSMGEKWCRPDTLSYNNLIEKLCKNDCLVKAEKLCEDMDKNGVSPDVKTFTVLMDACLEKDRPKDASAYFKAMVEANLLPQLEVYDRLIDGLVKAGKVKRAKSCFDMMVAFKLKMNDASYQNIMNALLDAGKHEEVLGIVSRMLREDPSDFSDELQEFVRGAFRKVGREEEVTKVMREVEREKADASAKERETTDSAKQSASLVVSQEATSIATAVAGETHAGQGEVVAEESSTLIGDSSDVDESAPVEAKSDDSQQLSV